MSTRSFLLRAYPAFGNQHFRLLWLGMLPATLSWQMSAVAVPYAAFALSGSATVLGLVSLATGVPLLIFGLVGGVAADRMARRQLILVSQSLLGAGALGVAVMALLGRLEVWHLAAASLLQGFAFSFNMPARQAYVAELVGRPMLPSAIALNNAGMNLCRIGGPALAGALLAAPGIGIGGVFVSMALMYAVVIATLSQLPVHTPETSPGGARSWIAPLVEGLSYVWTSPALRTLLSLALLVTFFGLPYQTLMPVFAEREFAAGAFGLGVLMTANGLGALVGALGFASLVQWANPSVLQAGVGVGFGLSLVGLALSPALPWAIVALALVGACSAAFGTLNNTLVVGHAEPRMYGRVMSVYLMTFASMPLGSLPLAWLADQFGARIAVAVAGVIVAAVVGGMYVLNPRYRQIS